MPKHLIYGLTTRKVNQINHTKKNITPIEHMNKKVDKYNSEDGDNNAELALGTYTHNKETNNLRGLLHSWLSAARASKS